MTVYVRNGFNEWSFLGGAEKETPPLDAPTEQFPYRSFRCDEMVFHHMDDEILIDIYWSVYKKDAVKGGGYWKEYKNRIRASAIKCISVPNGTDDD